MPSKDSSKQHAAPAGKKNGGSKKSAPPEKLSAVKTGAPKNAKARPAPERTPAQPATEGQAAAKENAAIVAVLTPTDGGSCSLPRRTATRLPRPRMRLAEAMRARGLDEHLVARVAGMFIRARVSQKKFDKLLVDMVDKVIRVLEPPRPADRTGPEPPTPVQLVHYMDRPVRDIPDGEPPESSPS